MGASLQLENFDKLMDLAVRHNPIIVNDISDATQDSKEAFNRLIYTRYNTDLLSNLPTCECGENVGEYLVGKICSNCHTPVVATQEQELEPIVWIRAPQGVRALINPIVWGMLNEHFTRNGYQILRHLCSPSYKPPNAVPKIMDEIMQFGWPRSYNFFVDNFDTIITQLFQMKGFKSKKNETDPLHQLVMEQRDCVFSKFLPLPNRALLVIEDNPMGVFVDPIVFNAVDAIRTLTGIDTPFSPHSQQVRENRTIKTIDQLFLFYDNINRTIIAKKEGIFRKHIYGTRSHFSFRAVISSITSRHHYEELHIPWGIGVSVFRIHLMSKLLRRGHTVNSALSFLNKHAQLYHPLLDALFQELIIECPYPGIPVVFQRNPSLERGSAQALFVTQVKTDVNIPTVSLSILDVVGFNADFDGDQLNGTLSIDHVTAEALEALAPHKSAFGLDEPRQVTKNFSWPKTVIATVASAMHSGMTEPEPEKLERMMALPDA